jgi:hypothetical protein
MRETLRSFGNAIRLPYLTCFAYLCVAFTYLVRTGYPGAPERWELALFDIFGMSVLASVAAVLLALPVVAGLLKFRRATYWWVTATLLVFATACWLLIGGFRA